MENINLNEMMSSGFIIRLLLFHLPLLSIVKMKHNFVVIRTERGTK